jgi:hypothetical protein
MLVEMRTYRIQAARVGEYLALYEAEGLALQCEVLGHLVGAFTTEFGPLNQVVYLWGFDSADERMRRRAQLAALPAWQAYVEKVRGLFVEQDSRLLSPTAFSPIR